MLEAEDDFLAVEDTLGGSECWLVTKDLCGEGMDSWGRDGQSGGGGWTVREGWTVRGGMNSQKRDGQSREGLTVREGWTVGRGIDSQKRDGQLKEG